MTISNKFLEESYVAEIEAASEAYCAAFKRATHHLNFATIEAVSASAVAANASRRKEVAAYAESKAADEAEIEAFDEYKAVMSVARKDFVAASEKYDAAMSVAASKSLNSN